MIDYEQVAIKELADRSPQYLADVYYHGIHNLTNSWHGENESDYNNYAAAFKVAARYWLDYLEETDCY